MFGSYVSVNQAQDLKAKFISWADSQKNAIQAARPTIMGLRASEEAISAEMQSADQQYGNNVKLIDDNMRKEEFAKVDSATTAETNEVIGDITKLKVQCPNYSMDAVTAAASAGDANKVGQLLMGFQPTM